MSDAGYPLLSKPETVALLETVTGPELMTNEAVVEPAFTVTVAGTRMYDCFVDKLTITPAAGAGPDSVTVPEDANPTDMAVGPTVSPMSRMGGITTFKVAPEV
jgi:hypothetical protein